MERNAFLDRCYLREFDIFGSAEDNTANLQISIKSIY
jgi:hypothetical protein